MVSVLLRPDTRDLRPELGHPTQIPRTGSADAFSGGYGEAGAGDCAENFLGGAVER